VLLVRWKNGKERKIRRWRPGEVESAEEEEEPSENFTPRRISSLFRAGAIPGFPVHGAGDGERGESGEGGEAKRRGVN